MGIDHDTATFAVESIRRWWRSMGKPVYRRAQRLLITADSGGSNGSRLRLWKLELQKLADETALHISVCHLPPGTSKWNKCRFGAAYSCVAVGHMRKFTISNAIHVSHQGKGSSLGSDDWWQQPPRALLLS